MRIGQCAPVNNVKCNLVVRIGKCAPVKTLLASNLPNNNDRILCVWRGRIGKYHLNSEKLGFNMDREPQARGPYLTPISKNEDGISQYVRARRTVFTLLSI